MPRLSGSINARWKVAARLKVIVGDYSEPMRKLVEGILIEVTTDRRAASDS
jgi:hypothetical protein